MNNYLDFLVQNRCFGCNKIGAHFCTECKCGFEPGRFQIWQNIYLRTCSQRNPAMMRAIAAWKDRHLTTLTPTLAGLLIENEPILVSAEPLQIITPPLRRKAFATRGFNSISLLAKELRKSNPNIYYDENSISYRYQPQDQRSLGIGERKFNVKGAFSVNQIFELPIVILDDVWTTGSTLRELVLAIAKPERVSTLLVLSTAYQVGTKDVWKSGLA